MDIFYFLTFLAVAFMGVMLVGYGLDQRGGAMQVMGFSVSAIVGALVVAWLIWLLMKQMGLHM